MAVSQALISFARGVWAVKVFAWWVFLPSFAGLCLIRGLLLPALLLGCAGLALGVQLLRARADVRVGERPGPFDSREMRVLGGLFLLINAAVAAAALWRLLFAPFDVGWERVDGSTDWNDTKVHVTADGAAVILACGPGKTSYWRDAGSGAWVDRGLPGLCALWTADDPARGWLWVASADKRVVNVFDRAQERWLELERPAGSMRGIAVAGDRVLLAAEPRLYWTDDEVDEWVVALDERVSGVDARGRRVVSVGARWRVSADAGDTWRELPRPDDALLYPEVSLGADRAYVFASTMIRGELWRVDFAAETGDEATLVELDPPAADIREIVVDPANSRRLWLGTWGEGVFVSDDAGEAWRPLGLESVSVRSLAVDARRGQLFVASGNLAYRRGVFVRALD
ncbi:MAG: hypothetical protein KC486_25335 [Myxococcales bacterium]|nr:hypothetical protein [Myxococcales bacterium]